MKVLGLFSLFISSALAATTVDILADDSRFSTLVNLVAQAGLVNDLNSGTFTIFAPTNDAFNKIPATTLASLANDRLALENLLKYHVVQGSVPSSAVTNELTLNTLDAKKIRFNDYSHNKIVTVQGSTITEFDKTASNGVIHVIDTVLTPPEGDIVDIVAKTSDVSTLLSLVQEAGLASTLRNGDGLTVFAPTNDAFSRLSDRYINKLKSDKNLLTEVLKYHVVPATEFSHGLYNRESLPTLDLNNDKLNVRFRSSGVRLNTNTHITKTDIGATNGVIHLIDHVLIPARYYRDFYVGK